MSQQGHVEVVRAGNVVYVGISITDAVLHGGVISGDQILIKGMTTPAGAPAAYSNSPLTTNEQFPIVFPAGVTVKPLDSIAVHIVAAAGTGAAVLLQVATSGGVAPVTRLEKLSLAGAETAILLQTSANQFMDVVLDKISFGKNNEGLIAKAAGGTLKVQVKDCKLADGVPIQTPPPISRKFSKGLDFRAFDDDGLVEATVENFTVFGLFAAAQMQPVPYSRTQRSHDLTLYANEITRLIEVFASSAKGNTDQGEHDANFAILPVPRVLLTINGGTLDGKAFQGDAGWDVGIYADTDSGGAVINDYFCLWDINMNGTIVRNCKAAGIYGETTVETRGMLQLVNVLVTKIGQTQTVDPSGYLHSGVHLVTQESYTAFLADQSDFVDNTGNGVYLMSNSSILGADQALPTGLYLDLDLCELHGNDLSGMYLDAAPNKPHFPATQGAALGGTIDWFPVGTRNDPSMIWEGNEPDPRLPRGQGVVNSCAVSNNGAYGIRVRARGVWYSGSQTVVNARFVNSFIWNNPLGGFYARLEARDDLDYAVPLLLTPLIHCTFAYNHVGGAGGWSVEVEPWSPTFANPSRSFYWDDEPTVSDNRILGTSIFNCVLQRSAQLDPDFGPHLEALERFDNGLNPFWIPQTDDIPWAGLRARISNIGMDSLVSTNTTSPFEGPIQPNFRLPAQFFLDNSSSGDQRFFMSHDYLHAGFHSFSETDNDYKGFNRGQYSLIQWDKGGEEE